MYAAGGEDSCCGRLTTRASRLKITVMLTHPPLASVRRRGAPLAQTLLGVTMRPSFLVSLFAAITLLAGCARPPEATVESFHKAVAKGEITEAQTYVSSQVTGMLGPEMLSAALAEESERITKCGGIKSIDVKLEGQGEVRSGTATITYGGECPPLNGPVKLIKEDGKWKIGAGK